MTQQSFEFRAWDVKNERMIYFNGFERFGFINHFLDQCSLSQGAKELLLTTDSKHYIWMQYVGIKDTKSDKIYSGDIIEYVIGIAPYQSTVRQIVVYYVDGFRFMLATKYRQRNFPHNETYHTPRRPNMKEWARCRVIGNIYENPELAQ